MKIVLSMICCALCLGCSVATASSLTGLWVPPGGDAIVELSVEKESGVIRLVEVFEPDLLDENNPKGRLRKRPLRGIWLGQDFEIADQAWQGGTIYDPDSGKRYRANLRLIEDDKLEVRGYVATPLLGKSQVWTSFESFSRRMQQFLRAGEVR